MVEHPQNQQAQPVLYDVSGAPLPPPPAYGRNSIADVLESASSLVAQGSLARPAHPLDDNPAFHSSADPLNLAQRLAERGVDPKSFRHACVIMVDGLGEELLNRYAGYAPALRKALNLGPLDAAFPTTTAASLSSLGTGTAPGAHGIAGYEVRNPAGNGGEGSIMNHLSGWDQSVDPHEWQLLSTVLERHQENRRVLTISLGKYRGTGLTEAGLRGGEFVDAQGFNARVTYALEALSSRTPTTVYLYWGELDAAGHRYGVGSEEWLQQLEELNSAVKRLSERAPAWAVLFVTADHGMVNVPEAHRVDYSEVEELTRNVAMTAGEPRAVHLYLEDTSDTVRAATASRWAEYWGERAWVIDSRELEAAGYFGPVVTDAARSRIGDLMVCARNDWALYDMRHYREHALHMVGQHGSLTEVERLVPLRLLPTA